MAHGIQDSIIEFNWPWNEQGRVVWLVRHLVLFLFWRGWFWWISLYGCIVNVVRACGLSLRRKRGINLEKRSMFKMPRNEGKS